MPRKTDGIEIEIHPGPKKGEDGKPLLYAQPLIDKKYSVKELDELCSKSHYTHKHQIENALLTSSMRHPNHLLWYPFRTIA